jgi:hypothetical protein
MPRHGRPTPDLLGCRFYNLVVIDKAPPSKGNKTIWKCQCDCGAVKLVGAHELRVGNTKSCGCRKGRYLPKGDAIFNAVFRSYENHANDRNLAFDLSIEEFKNITQQNCFYCGVAPFTTRKYKNNHFTYNGIDRVDNSLGYSLENAVPCCKICNSAKSDRSYDDFISWVERIHEHIVSK